MVHKLLATSDEKRQNTIVNCSVWRWYEARGEEERCGTPVKLCAQKQEGERHAGLDSTLDHEVMRTIMFM